MKTLIFTAALPFLACAARAQDTPPAKDAPAETVKKAHAAAWLGIAMAESDDKVVVGQVVPGSPADKAGLKDGDRILRIGDSAIEGRAERVLETVGQHKPGDTIKLLYLRGDKEETVKIELAERPAQLEGDFRGEFRREKEKIEQTLKEKVQDSNKEVEDAKRTIERLKEEVKKELVPKTEDAKQKLEDKIERLKGTIEEKLQNEKTKLRDEHEQLENLHLKKTEAAKKRFEEKIELNPFKDRPHPDLSLETPRVDPKKGEPEGGKLFRYYLDRKWPGDNVKGHTDEAELRLSFELPLLDWKKGQKPGVKFMELKTKDSAASEAAIWGRVQDSVARALKESDIGPDVSEKVMKAVKEARRAGIEKDARRTRLEAEAAKLEKEMQALKERSDKLREELKKSTE